MTGLASFFGSARRATPSPVAAFETEVMLHVHSCYGAALRFTRSPDAAQDLVRETYQKARKSKDELAVGADARTWLFRILTSTYYAKYRAFDTATAPAGDEVSAALDSVPSDLRTVVILADIEGFSYKAIAEIVQIPVGTVMSRLLLGRRLLQDELAHHTLEDGVLKPNAPTADAPLSLDEFRKRRTQQ